MAYSKAFRRFKEGRKDIYRLLQLHKEKAGPKPGRKRGVEVLAKSAIVLTCAYWEAYVEDVCEEALSRLLAGVRDPLGVPDDLRMAVARRVRKDDDERAPWRLALDRWREECMAHVLEKLQKLNNPKSERVEEVFKLALGIVDITSSWVRRRMSRDKARAKLDEFINLRGSIAHRGSTMTTVLKKQCTDFLEHVEKLARSTDTAIRQQLKQLTGRGFSVK